MKGTKQLIKKTLAIIMLIVGITHLFTIGIFIALSRTIIGLLLLAAAYFLIFDWKMTEKEKLKYGMTEEDIELLPEIKQEYNN